MKPMEIDLPDATFTAELRAAVAAKWYEIGRVSQEVASRIAGSLAVNF
jgi:hypothetical protein